MQCKLKFTRPSTPERTVLTKKFNTMKQVREFIKKHDKEIIQADIWTFDGWQWYQSIKLK